MPTLHEHFAATRLFLPGAVLSDKARGILSSPVNVEFKGMRFALVAGSRLSPFANVNKADRQEFLSYKATGKNALSYCA